MRRLILLCRLMETERSFGGGREDTLIASQIEVGGESHCHRLASRPSAVHVLMVLRFDFLGPFVAI